MCCASCQSTDDAYVRERRHGDQPENRGLHQKGEGRRQPDGGGGRESSSSSTTATSRPRLRRPRRRLRPRKRQSRLMRAGSNCSKLDDRPGRGRGAVRRGQSVRAQQDYKRYNALMTSDFASRQRFEQAEADARKAEAAAAKSHAALAAAQSQLALLAVATRAKKRRGASRRGQLRLAKNDLDNTVIRAPIRGRRQPRRPGRPIRQARTQLLSLVPLPKVYVTANFKETQLTRMRPGQHAAVRSTPIPTSRWPAARQPRARHGAQFACCRRTTRPAISPRSCSACRCASRCRRADRWPRPLRPGLSVTVTIDTRRDRANRWATGSSARRGPIPMSALRERR